MTRLFMEDGGKSLSPSSPRQAPGGRASATPERTLHRRPAGCRHRQGQAVLRGAIARPLRRRQRGTQRKLVMFPRDPRQLLPWARKSWPTIISKASPWMSPASRSGKGFGGSMKSVKLRRPGARRFFFFLPLSPSFSPPHGCRSTPLARLHRTVPGPGQVFKGQEDGRTHGAARLTTQDLQVVRNDANRGLINGQGRGSRLQGRLGDGQEGGEEAVPEKRHSPRGSESGSTEEPQRGSPMRPPPQSRRRRVTLPRREGRQPNRPRWRPHKAESRQRGPAEDAEKRTVRHENRRHPKLDGERPARSIWAKRFSAWNRGADILQRASVGSATTRSKGTTRSRPVRDQLLDQEDLQAEGQPAEHAHGEPERPDLPQGWYLKGSDQPRSHGHDLTRSSRGSGSSMRCPPRPPRQTSSSSKPAAKWMRPSNIGAGPSRIKKPSAGSGRLIIDGGQVDEELPPWRRANIEGLDVLPSMGANVYDILKAGHPGHQPRPVSEALEARLGGNTQ